MELNHILLPLDGHYNSYGFRSSASQIVATGRQPGCGWWRPTSNGGLCLRRRPTQPFPPFFSRLLQLRQLWDAAVHDYGRTGHQRTMTDGLRQRLLHANDEQRGTYSSVFSDRRRPSGSVDERRQHLIGKKRNTAENCGCENLIRHDSSCSPYQTL